jgi:hypothetical protein
MNFEVLIPIALFAAIAYTIKVVADMLVRRRLVESNVSEALVRSMIEGDAERARTASLRWGIVMTALAVGFGLVEAGGWDDMTPGVVGILLGATGLGNLAYYALVRRRA